MDESLPTSINPVAKSLYLCDYVFGNPDGKTDLRGLINAIFAESFPHVQGEICVFAQLLGGLGEVGIHIDIREARTNSLIHTSHLHRLEFSFRNELIQVVVALQEIHFPNPGIYLVEMFCNNIWIADTTIELS
jgi:hypothetical protein